MTKALARMQLNRQADPRKLNDALPFEVQGADHYTESTVWKADKTGLLQNATVVPGNASETSAATLQ
jgi:hypothetical protein